MIAAGVFGGCTLGAPSALFSRFFLSQFSYRKNRKMVHTLHIVHPPHFGTPGAHSTTAKTFRRYFDDPR